MRGLTVIAAVLLAAGCATTNAEPVPDEPDGDDVSACERAFADAAEAGEAADTVQDMYPAAKACGSLNEWMAASDAHPGLVDEIDPEMFARNVCQYGPDEDPELADAALCVELSRDG